jgi:hypothetical protein
LAQQIVRAVDLDRYVDPDGWTVQVDEVEYSDGRRQVMLYVWKEDDEDGELVMKQRVRSVDQGLRLMHDMLAACKRWYADEEAIGD